MQGRVALKARVAHLDGRVPARMGVSPQHSGPCRSQVDRSRRGAPGGKVTLSHVLPAMTHPVSIRGPLPSPASIRRHGCRGSRKAATGGEPHRGQRASLSCAYHLKQSLRTRGTAPRRSGHADFAATLAGWLDGDNAARDIAASGLSSANESFFWRPSFRPHSRPASRLPQTRPALARHRCRPKTSLRSLNCSRPRRP